LTVPQILLMLESSTDQRLLEGTELGEPGFGFGSVAAVRLIEHRTNGPHRRPANVARPWATPLENASRSGRAECCAARLHCR